MAVVFPLIPSCVIFVIIVVVVVFGQGLIM